MREARAAQKSSISATTVELVTTDPGMTRDSTCRRHASANRQASPATCILASARNVRWSEGWGEGVSMRSLSDGLANGNECPVSERRSFRSGPSHATRSKTQKHHDCCSLEIASSCSFPWRKRRGKPTPHRLRRSLWEKRKPRQPCPLPAQALIVANLFRLADAAMTSGKEREHGPPVPPRSACAQPRRTPEPRVWRRKDVAHQLHPLGRARTRVPRFSPVTKTCLRLLVDIAAAGMQGVAE